MLNRLRSSPWVRSGLLAIVIGFCAYGLYVEWPDASAALTRLHWYSVVGAALCAAAGAGFFMLAWRELLTDLGSRLPVPAAVRVDFVGQLAKYVPGVVWTLAAQVELGKDYDVPRQRTAASVVTALIVSLGTGLMIAAVTLPLTSANASRHYWWALAVTPLILLCLYPPVLGRLLNRALAVVKQPPLERQPSPRGLAKVLAWTVLGWLFWGLQAWLLVSAVVGRGAHVLLLSVGAYALAWAAGILIVVFPGGIGPREIALIAALAPVAPRGAALAIALVSRLVMTCSDLAWGGIGLAIGRHSRRAASGHPSPPRRAPAPDGGQPQAPTPGELGADIQIT